MLRRNMCRVMRCEHDTGWRLCFTPLSVSETHRSTETRIFGLCHVSRPSMKKDAHKACCDLKRAVLTPQCWGQRASESKRDYRI